MSFVHGDRLLRPIRSTGRRAPPYSFRRRNTRVVVGLLLGALLGAFVGAATAARFADSHSVRSSFGEVSFTAERPLEADDDCARDPVIARPLCGLLLGAAAGAASGAAYHQMQTLRRGNS